MDLIRRDMFLFVFLVLLVVLSVFNPSYIIEYPSFVDWKTIKALLGLLLITTGLKESGYFSVFSRELVSKFKAKRSLAAFMIFLSAFLSTFLTNDVALFVVVPLTLSMPMVKDTIKLVVFEAIAVNVGSALTPFGNPQNLFLWHRWGISFVKFVVEMIPPVAIMLGILLIFAWIAFRKECVGVSKTEKMKVDTVLLSISLTMLIVFIVSLEMGRVDMALILTLTIFALFYRKVLLSADWMLLLLFVIIFIDFHIISTLPITLKIMKALNPDSEGRIFLLSVLASQVLSNVPASVLLSRFTHNLRAVVYGVNVGGNGLVISSLANIIALRMVRKKGAWFEFHKCSVSFLLASGLVVYLIFFS